MKRNTNTEQREWINYQTSNVVQWLENDAATRQFWQEQARRQRDGAEQREQVKRNAMDAETAAVFYLAEQLKTAILESNPIAKRASLYSDLLAYSIKEVCFEQIADRWLSELPIEDDYVHAYTRQNAVDDGVLIDVTDTAKEAGFDCPTALTRAVWCNYVQVPEGVQHQDESGRLWDVLWMLRHAKTGSSDLLADELEYQLLVANDNSIPKLVTLKAVCGPGDDPAPTITIMLPEED